MTTADSLGPFGDGVTPLTPDMRVGQAATRPGIFPAAVPRAGHVGYHDRYRQDRLTCPWFCTGVGGGGPEPLYARTRAGWAAGLPAGPPLATPGTTASSMSSLVEAVVGTLIW